MQKSKDTNESGWKTATRPKKRGRKNNEQQVNQSNKPSNKPPVNRSNRSNPSNPSNNRSEYGRYIKTDDKWSRLPNRNQYGRIDGRQYVAKTKKNTEYTPPQPVYNGPDFAGLISKNDETLDVNTSGGDTENTEHKSIVIPIPRIPMRFRNSVRNQVPRINTNNSYGAWEFAYFNNILDLHSIFADAIDEIGIDGVDTNSADFIHVFGKFIKECSSGEISPYIEDLTETEEMAYMAYTIKRNEY